LSVLVVVANTGNVTLSGIELSATLGTLPAVHDLLAPLAPGASRYVRMPAIAVVKASMARCNGSGDAGDRCAALTVSAGAPTGPSATRVISLAFFVG
jgi:hypothetical protein